jgi:hypothetical protein
MRRADVILTVSSSIAPDGRKAYSTVADDGKSILRP